MMVRLPYSQTSVKTNRMTLAQRILMLASVLLVGCGAPVVTPQVASLAESPASKTLAPAVVQTPVDAAPLKADAPRYTVRKAVIPPAEPAIPRVLLSAGHAKLCQIKVGESFPALKLPLLGGPMTELAAFCGKQATVVLFWHPDRWMARTALVDMQRDIASQFAAEQVAVVGIAVRQPMGAVQAALNTAQATFPQLIDTDGKAFATVGTTALPRLYVLDPAGKIVWFDIEYSEGTRRELWQTLRVLTQPANN